MKKEEIITILDYLQFEKSFNGLGLNNYGKIMKLINDDLKIITEIPKDLEQNYFIFLQYCLNDILNKYDFTNNENLYQKMIFIMKEFEKLENKKKEIYADEFIKILEKEINRINNI